MICSVDYTNIKMNLLVDLQRDTTYIKLVYFEEYSDPLNAIEREKQLKGLLRIKKKQIVETMNPEWNDLSFKLFPGVFEI